jgi:hypothetical protein
LNVLNPVSLTEGGDGWSWLGGDGGIFSVKDAYVTVSNLLIPRDLISPHQQFVFKVIWKSMAPSKVASFDWLVLRDRVPTRENLMRRRMVLAEGQHQCVFCGEYAETVNHLFIYCKVSMQIWTSVFAWLGLCFQLPHNVTVEFNGV